MRLRALLLLLSLMSAAALAAQTVGGSWYGRADVQLAGVSSNYLTGMVLKQNGRSLEGIFGYYFKNAYQTFFVRGSFDKNTRQVDIQNVPFVFYASPTADGVECTMHFRGTLMVSRVASTIKGVFYAEDRYKYTCPELLVNFRRDTTLANTDSLLRQGVGRTLWQPHGDDVVIDAANASPDTLAGKLQTGLLEAFSKRSNVYEKDIVVHDDSLLVSLYDNGDIDHDTISVFLNKKPVLLHRGLSSRALNLYIGLDPKIAVNELTLFADNLGTIPPNTALMVISDGSQRHEVYLSASLKQNASVRLRKQ